MTYLPDVNLWIALVVAEHTQHVAAMEWFKGAVDDTVAFCRVTQMGFLRLLTNPRVMAGDALTAGRAWQLLDRVERDHRVVFAFEPAGVEPVWRAMTGYRDTGPNFWTDAYLAAFVNATGYTLVTFDRGFEKHKGLAVRLLR